MGTEVSEVRERRKTSLQAPLSGNRGLRSEGKKEDQLSGFTVTNTVIVQRYEPFLSFLIQKGIGE